LQRARIYRARHDLTRSSAMLGEVEPKLRRDLPAGHYAFAVLASEQSLLAQDGGDLQTASRLANQALTLAQTAAQAGRQGVQVLPILLIRRSSIKLQLGDPDDAAADAARGLSSLKETSEPGTYSNIVGRAYLTLARALLAQGKGEEARAAARSAAEHFQSTIGVDHPDTRSARQLAELDSNRP
jgi:tetratricopeptide (TPR) repeat protein